MSGMGHDGGYLPSSLVAPDGAKAPYTRFNPLILSRRARQIQADEGVLPAHLSRGRLPDSSAELGPAESIAFDSARTVRGRARAGTLPSSWDHLPAPTLSTPASLQPSKTSSDDDFRNRLTSSTATTGPSSSSPSPSPFRHQQHLHSRIEGRPALHLPIHTEASAFRRAEQANSRIRSGSLTLPDDGFGNAFGPSIFSTWHPSRSGLGSLAMTADAELSAPQSGSTGAGEDEFGGRDAFDGSSTLDYLGLADVAPRQQDVVSTSLRNRASTLASSAARPRLGPIDGRTRSSSFLPGFNFEYVNERDEVGASSDRLHPNAAAPASSARPSPLASSSLHPRVNQYGDTLSADYGQEPGSWGQGARPRATSMGGLDGPGSSSSNLTPPMSATMAIEIDEEAIREYAVEQNIDPNEFVTFAQATALRASFSNGTTTPVSLAGRHRAGTIVAHSGPGGRQRTEQELMRMSLASLPGQKRPNKPSSLGHFLDTSAAVEATGGHTQRHTVPLVTATGSPTPNGQSGHSSHPPSRSLYIGQLSPATTGQELMQAFAPYGAIDTLRLLPDKECGFINFVEMQDAIKAKEDIMARFGGKIALKSTSPDGAIRIGFGKIDAISQGSQGLGIGGTAHRGTPSPRLENSAVDGSLGGATDHANEQPTRALWIGSIPATTSLSQLLSIFTPFGPIESVRVLATRNCGFVNFERVDDAVRARKALHGREVLGAVVGGVRIGFAKAPTKSQDGQAFVGESSTPEFPTAVDAPVEMQGASIVPMGQQLSNGGLDSYRSNMVLGMLENRHPSPSIGQGMLPMHKSPSGHSLSRQGPFTSHSSSNSIAPSSDKGGVPLPAEMRPQATVSDWQLLMRQLDEGDRDVDRDVEAVAKGRSLATYYTQIPSVAESTNSRKFDTARLRELRKGIEANGGAQTEIDRIASDFLADIVDLSSDFIGNTLVQRFFEKCSDALKVSMLERIAPHLAKIGIHKNGTWAAQKIIDCATTDEQRALIAEHLRPYVPPLLTDQFGNYVVQKVIPFGSPHSDFIFDAMIDRCWEVAQGRFGARSMRAVLESPQSAKLQRKRVAAAIILNSVPLATSQNGSLLVTWLLDSSQLPGRYRLLVPRFTPHLAHLCTHKLASLTLLRIVQQNLDPDASRQVLKALLDPAKPNVLEEIVKDQIHGSQFLSKLLASPNLDQPDRQVDRQVCAERVWHLLRQHNLLGLAPYRALVEQLGFASVGPPGAVMPAGARSATLSALPSMPPPQSGLFPYAGQAPIHLPAASQLFAEATGSGLGPTYPRDGLAELDHAMNYMSLPLTYPHQVPRDARPSSQGGDGPGGGIGGSPMGPPLAPMLTFLNGGNRSGSSNGNLGGGDFAAAPGGATPGRAPFHSNGVLRSPTSDAFNPWSQIAPS